MEKNLKTDLELRDLRSGKFSDEVKKRIKLEARSIVCFIGICPFCGHHSLNVNDHTERFYCFGCHAKGTWADWNGNWNDRGSKTRQGSNHHRSTEPDAG